MSAAHPTMIYTHVSDWCYVYEYKAAWLVTALPNRGHYVDDSHALIALRPFSLQKHISYYEIISEYYTSVV